MTRDGHYVLSYRALDGLAESSGLAMLREGRVLGSDAWGGMFHGICYRDAASKTDRISVTFSMPPSSELITGFTSGADGATLNLTCELVSRDGVSKVGVVDVAGQALEVELMYVGAIT